MKQEGVKSYLPIRKGRDACWARLYGKRNGAEFERWKQTYVQAYQDMAWKEERTLEETIQSCTQSAMETGSHLAFVHCYLEMGKYDQELFGQSFVQELERMQVNGKSGDSGWFGNQKKGAAPLLLMDGRAFLNREADRKAILEARENVLAGRKTAKDRTQLASVVFKSAGTLRSWGRGNELPQNKYELVQCGLYLHLDARGVNRLLKLAGKQELYAANPVDFLCMVYLDVFAKMAEQEGKQDVFEDESGVQEQSFQRVIHLKEEINALLAAYIEATKDARDKKIVELEKKAVRMVTKDLFFPARLIEEKEGEEKKEKKKEVYFLERNIKRLKQETQQFLDQTQTTLRKTLITLREEEQITGYAGPVTMLYQNQQHLLTDDVEKLYGGAGKEAGDEADRLLAKRIVNSDYLKQFTIQYYKLQERILQYVSDVKAYEKNIVVPDLILRECTQRHVTLEQLNPAGWLWKEPGQEEGQYLINRLLQRRYLEKGNKISDYDRIAILEQIWHYGNKEGAAGQKTAVRQLLFGREFEPARIRSEGSGGREPQGAKRQERTGQKGEHRKAGAAYYQADIGSRNMLIQFALACGKEENLGRLLLLAGYRDYRGSREKTDLFLQYVIAFRDALIDRWCGDDSMKAQEYRENFPLLLLCREVNQDIQFILEYLGGFYEEVDGDCAAEHKQIKSEFQDFVLTAAETVGCQEEYHDLYRKRREKFCSFCAERGDLTDGERKTLSVLLDAAGEKIEKDVKIQTFVQQKKDRKARVEERYRQNEKDGTDEWRQKIRKQILFYVRPIKQELDFVGMDRDLEAQYLGKLFQSLASNRREIYEKHAVLLLQKLEQLAVTKVHVDAVKDCLIQAWDKVQKDGFLKEAVQKVRIIQNEAYKNAEEETDRELQMEGGKSRRELDQAIRSEVKKMFCEAEQFLEKARKEKRKAASQRGEFGLGLTENDCAKLYQSEFSGRMGNSRLIYPVRVTSEEE